MTDQAGLAGAGRQGRGFKWGDLRVRLPTALQGGVRCRAEGIPGAGF